MSKNRHFFAYLLLPILISGCTLRPETAPPVSPDSHPLTPAEQDKKQLEQEVARLQEQLQATRQAKQLLKQQHQQLQEKVDALTDIERSLYERRLEHSE